MFSSPSSFNSSMSKGQTIAVLAYLPVHIVLIPLVLSVFMEKGMSQESANLLYYSIGTVYMLCTTFSFLRRDFDPLWEKPFSCLMEVLRGYVLMYLCNLVLGLLSGYILGPEQSMNPNNDSIMSMASQDWGKVSAMAIFLAPIVEELLFRAGIFGTLRRRSRLAAYLLSVLAFSLYHVYPYLLLDWRNAVYIIQYLPVSFILCMVYERSGTIWCSIFFHMLNNWLSMQVLSSMKELL